jgi:hypothetical protein
MRPSSPRASRLLAAALALSAATACGRHPEEEDGTKPSAAPTPVASASAAPRPAAPAANASGETWNAAQIEWHGFNDGMLKAEQQNKPVMLVVSTTWCPHCKNYSHVFDDPRVVAHARDFVMIRIDSDAEPDIAARYAKDGGYIPRTYFLGPDGTANTAIHAPRARYQYFYDEKDPSALLASMDAEVRTQKL